MLLCVWRKHLLFVYPAWLYILYRLDFRVLFCHVCIYYKYIYVCWVFVCFVQFILESVALFLDVLFENSGNWIVILPLSIDLVDHSWIFSNVVSSWLEKFHFELLIIQSFHFMVFTAKSYWATRTLWNWCPVGVVIRIQFFLYLGCMWKFKPTIYLSVILIEWFWDLLAFSILPLNLRNSSLINSVAFVGPL